MGTITFESQSTFIKEQINKRRSNWRLSTLDWDDAAQIIFIRIWQKWFLYDPEQKLENWVNTVITNQIKNLLRDNLTKFSRPCVQKCIFNLGGNACGYTKSGLQSNECPKYAEWQKKKEAQFNIKASLPLENHTQEVNNKQSDFLDIKSAKEVIDIKIKPRLNRRERKLYKVLYIDNMTAQEACEFLKQEESKIYEPESYAKILEFQKKVISISKKIIQEEDLAG